jgi:hypothetical protein
LLVFKVSQEFLLLVIGNVGECIHYIAKIAFEDLTGNKSESLPNDALQND